MREPTRLTVLAGIALILIACGEAQPNIAAPGSSSAPAPTETAAEPASTTPSTAAPSPASSAAPPTNEEIVVGDSRITFTLPTNAVHDERQETTTPEFVLAKQRWYTPGCCALTVVVQNVQPLLDGKDAVSFDAGGLRWSLQPVGPEDGSVLVATATGGDLSLLISGDDMSRTALETVARSVRITTSGE